MEIKKGQWARLSSNKFLQIEKSYGDVEYDGFGRKLKGVADTPQELIEVGDLVFINESIELIKKVLIEKGWTYFIDEYKNYCAIETITKILTPNQNGGYDLQWEDNNE